MDSEPTARRWFSRADAMVAALICFFIISLLTPGVQSALEAARRTSCNCCLKQVGLGIQNYHDIQNEICPGYLTDDMSLAAEPRDFAAWPVLLLPYMEQTNVYELADLSMPLSKDAAPPANHPLLRTVSIGTYFCRARRSPPELTVNGAGAVGDWAGVSRADAGPGVVNNEPRTWDGAMVPSKLFNASHQPATIDGVELGPGDYRAMLSFDDILDGLSNTVFIGEKAVHRKRMGGNAKNFQLTRMAGEQDGTYYYGSGGHAPANLKAPGTIAYWSRALSPRYDGRTIPLDPRNEDPQNRFGSWHPGITLFALGDGSVRQVNNATSSTILQRLGSRNDRLTFDLP